MIITFVSLSVVVLLIIGFLVKAGMTRSRRAAMMEKRLTDAELSLIHI